MDGYEQLVPRGAGLVRDERRASTGSGSAATRGASPTGSDLELVRTVSAWLGDEDGGIALSSLRPPERAGHDEERCGRRSSSATASRSPVADPRLSTTYDGDGHQRRAGLELWVDDEDPTRAARPAR